MLSLLFIGVDFNMEVNFVSINTHIKSSIFYNLNNKREIIKYYYVMYCHHKNEYKSQPHYTFGYY